MTTNPNPNSTPTPTPNPGVAAGSVPTAAEWGVGPFPSPAAGQALYRLQTALGLPTTAEERRAYAAQTAADFAIDAYGTTPRRPNEANPATPGTTATEAAADEQHDQEGESGE